MGDSRWERPLQSERGAGSPYLCRPAGGSALGSAHGRGVTAPGGFPRTRPPANNHRVAHVRPEGLAVEAVVRREAGSSAATMSDDPPREAAAALKGDPNRAAGEPDEEEEDEKEIENPPWYATALVRTLLVVLAVLLLTSCLLVFGKARMSSREVEELEEQWEHSIDMAHIIDVPARCPQGQRYFRGKCRRVF
ncbi:Protein of unknown function [Gryllus bimaculatus]|nr:Protein of unknown function [Gryllus bimaculatus]